MWIKLTNDIYVEEANNPISVRSISGLNAQIDELQTKLSGIKLVEYPLSCSAEVKTIIDEHNRMHTSEIMRTEDDINSLTRTIEELTAL